MSDTVSAAVSDTVRADVRPCEFTGLTDCKLCMAPVCFYCDEPEWDGEPDFTLDDLEWDDEYPDLCEDEDDGPNARLALLGTPARPERTRMIDDWTNYVTTADGIYVDIDEADAARVDGWNRAIDEVCRKIPHTDDECAAMMLMKLKPHQSLPNDSMKRGE